MLGTADFDCSRSGSLRTVFGGFFLFGDLAIGTASFGRAEQHEPNALSCPPERSPVLNGLDLRERDLCPSGHKVAQLPNSPSAIAAGVDSFSWLLFCGRLDNL